MRKFPPRGSSQSLPMFPMTMPAAWTATRHESAPPPRSLVSGMMIRQPGWRFRRERRCPRRSMSAGQAASGGHPRRPRNDREAAYLPAQPAGASAAKQHRRGGAGVSAEILDETGAPVPPDTPGTLYLRGASAATGYWSQYAASRQVFQGE